MSLFSKYYYYTIIIFYNDSTKPGYADGYYKTKDGLLDPDEIKNFWMKNDETIENVLIIFNMEINKKIFYKKMNKGVSYE